MVQKMKKGARVPRNDWLKFLDRFAAGNQGRPVRLETFRTEVDAEEVGRCLPLLSINYDPDRKGDVLTIATGRSAVEYEHTIEAPKEIWVDRDETGRGQAMEIVSETGRHTVVTFEQ